MSIVILVRHGESETNVRNIVSSDIYGYPLTSRGREQASNTGQQLRDLEIAFFQTSPVQRAIETSRIISEHIRLSPTIDGRIIESDMGKYNNKSLTEIPKSSRKELGMETWESHQERFLKVLSEVNDTTLLVSHAFPIRAALSHYLDLDEMESYGIDIRYATISVLDLDKEEVLCIGSKFLSDRVRKIIKESR